MVGKPNLVKYFGPSFSKKTLIILDISVYVPTLNPFHSRIVLVSPEQRLLRMMKRLLWMMKTLTETNVLHPKKLFHGYDFIVIVYELALINLLDRSNSKSATEGWPCRKKWVPHGNEPCATLKWQKSM